MGGDVIATIVIVAVRVSPLCSGYRKDHWSAETNDRLFNTVWMFVIESTQIYMSGA
jgi:hypothetical protein